MTRSWILIANASSAKIYETPRAKLFNGHCHLKLVQELEHPESRLKESDLIATVSGHKNLPESVEPRSQEHEKFAKELVDQLVHGRNKHAFEDLIIVAPAQFMGQLNKKINGVLKPLISKTIEKDYTKLNEEKIQDCLVANI